MPQQAPDEQKLMSPARTKEAISFQVQPLITAATNSLLGGVSATPTTPFRSSTATLRTASTTTPKAMPATTKKQTPSRAVELAQAPVPPTSLQVHSLQVEYPPLDASKVASGSLSSSRIPNLRASKITSATLSSSRIPASGRN